MSPGLRFAIPAIIFFTMVVVGLALTPDDFRRVMRRPGGVFLGLLGQMTLLPLLAITLLKLFEPSFELVVGILLVAACPAGGMTNYLAYLARADAAFSVTLTAVGTLLAVPAMPLILWVGFVAFPEAGAEIGIPILQTALQLLILILLPIGLGMASRAANERSVLAWEPRLRALSLAGTLGVVMWILYDQRGGLASGWKEIVLLTVLFTALSMSAGFAVGCWSGFSAEERLTLVIEYSGRNLGIAVVIAVGILGRVEFLVFASILFVVSILLVLPAIRLFRRKSVRS